MARPDRATFRLPAWALLLPIMLLFLITPLATVAAGWGVLFVVPVAALAWVVTTRTTATGTRVTTYGLLGRRRMDWKDLDRLEVRDTRWVVAVGTQGRRLRLPMVRPHDLRRLITVSGGSLQVGDPGIAQDGPPEATAEPQSDPAAHPHPEPVGRPALPDSTDIAVVPAVNSTSDARVAEQARPGP